MCDFQAQSSNQLDRERLQRRRSQRPPLRDGLMRPQNHYNQGAFCRRIAQVVNQQNAAMRFRVAIDQGANIVLFRNKYIRFSISASDSGISSPGSVDRSAAYVTS
jgi:hypothetical protein